MCVARAAGLALAALALACPATEGRQPPHAPRGAFGAPLLARTPLARVRTSARVASAAPAAPASAADEDEARQLGDESLARGPAHSSGMRRRVIRRGDYVVHRELGVARFLGVLKRPAGRWLVLEFSDEEYELPTAEQQQISLFRRADEALLKPVRLSSTKRVAVWRAKKAKARTQLDALTSGLLVAYRERQRLERPPCPADDARFDAFVANCTFELTDDQHRACADIAADMCVSARPMDRLLCGDVGFGKTEVANRALMRCALAGRQAAVLAPTTVLAWQHHKSMCARMPTLRVGLLTRLTPAADARRVLLTLAEGELDVLIGTHAILSKRVAWARLGLMVVDEEHRFGVHQKEKVKALCVGVDFLALTATPIPRTLSMGLCSLRDMSVLNTPPPGRLAVRTVCAPYTTQLVRDAVRDELARGGQLFYVVPRISMIEPALALLGELFPSAALEWAHGGLPDLDARMLRFGNGTARVLVSTSVIECGIDLPSVNTLIVEHAHMFGLASLHQLRGRVGRSAAQAHAYLLTPPEERLTPEASARLKTLEAFSELGDGYELSQADLALRGAGNLLGPEQSGNMHAIGADLFFEMLDEAIEQARANEQARAPGNAGAGGAAGAQAAGAEAPAGAAAASREGAPAPPQGAGADDEPPGREQPAQPGAAA